MITIGGKSAPVIGEMALHGCAFSSALQLALPHCAPSVVVSATVSRVSKQSTLPFRLFVIANMVMVLVQEYCVGAITGC